jgi:two-component system sensor histidine kinase/response regulator
MPLLSGEDLARRIRSNPVLAETKLILVSSSGRHGLGQTSRDALDAVLDKPLRQRDLFDCLVRLYQDADPIVPALDAGVPAESVASATLAIADRALRILLAEDNKVNQLFATKLLGKMGHHVDVVENGHQAVDAVRHADYDVVLMDVQMPELDGMEATRQIRALAPPKCDVAIIALTAHAMAGAREHYLAAGMNDYVSKPIQSDLLRSKLAALASAAPPHRAIAGTAPSPAAIAGTASLDLAKLAALEELFEGDDLREYVTMFLVNTEERLVHLREASERADLPAMAREAHKLVGTAGSVGAMRVHELAVAVEAAAKAGEGDAAHRLASDLAEASATASASLAAWLQQHAGADVPVFAAGGVA